MKEIFDRQTMLYILMDFTIRLCYNEITEKRNE